MKRRTFIHRSMSAGVAMALAGKAFANDLNRVDGFASSEKAYYVSMSGNVRADHLVAVGLLEALQPDVSRTAFDQYRIDYSYNSELTYRSNDKYKLDFAKAVIDHLIYTNYAFLSVKVIQNANAEFEHLSPDQRRERKTEYYKSLIDDFGGVPRIYAKSESQYGPSHFFESAFEGETAASYEALRSKDEDLLQMADLLTGSVLADMRGGTESWVKSTLIEYFKSGLGISSFYVGLDHEKIRIA